MLFHEVEEGWNWDVKLIVSIVSPAFFNLSLLESIGLVVELNLLAFWILDGLKDFLIFVVLKEFLSKLYKESSVLIYQRCDSISFSVLFPVVNLYEDMCGVFNG